MLEDYTQTDKQIEFTQEQLRIYITSKINLGHRVKMTDAEIIIYDSEGEEMETFKLA